MSDRITLKDIARRLNLSVAAISMALHNDPSISEAQRKRIHEVAESMGYRPDPGLSALSAYRLKSGVRPAFAPLAFAEFNPLGDYWTDTFYYGAREQAERMGYRLNFHHLSPDLSLKRHAHILQSQGVRGLILGPLPTGMTTLDFDWSHFSVVAIGRSLAHPELNRAAPDVFEALLMAVEKVRQRRSDKIGIAITHEQDHRVGSIWTAAGALMCLKGEQISIFENAEDQEEPFLAWLKKEKPKVVISLQHPVPDWIRGAGFRVPEDIEVVLLDHDIRLKCPGIQQNFMMVGAAAMTLLHSSLVQGEVGIPKSRQTLLVQPRWMDLATTDNN